MGLLVGVVIPSAANSLVTNDQIPCPLYLIMFPFALETAFFGLVKSLSVSLVFLKIALISGSIVPGELALSVFKAILELTTIYAVISGQCAKAVELVMLEGTLIGESVV